MLNPKRIFIISDFKENSPFSINSERRRWIKGFIRLGHDVQKFSYQDIARQNSFFKKREWALKIGKRKTQDSLIAQIKAYHPNIIMVLTMKDIEPNFILELRDLCRKAVFIGRDVDWFPHSKPNRIEIAKKMDIVIATNAGTWLHEYKDVGVPLCAFIPCPCDPDIQKNYDLDEKLQTDIIFTGKVVHCKNTDSFDIDRTLIMNRLNKMPNAKIYGSFGHNKISGIDTFLAISNSKIALSINAVNNVRMYHSDRLINYLSCGTFTLAKRVPDSELLFKDNIEIKYFENAEDFFSLADYYLKNEKERKRIAHNGMLKAHDEFNCVRMAKHVDNLIETGIYNAEWKYII